MQIAPATDHPQRADLLGCESASSIGSPSLSEITPRVETGNGAGGAEWAEIPSFIANGVTLLCADARKLSIIADALVTDPPYGMGYVSRHNDGHRRKQFIRTDGNFAPIVGDDGPFDPAVWLNFERVCLWGANHYASRLPDSRGWLVWDKLAGKTPSQQSDCELAWTNQDKPLRIFEHLWRGIMRAGEENVSRSRKLHPNQKPVALMQWCLDQLGVPTGARVYDPFMGSGSTGVACVRTGREFIGVECDPEHFKTAVTRIKKEL